MAIESAFVTPIVLALVFFCVQLILIFLCQVTLQMGASNVIAKYEALYIKNPDPLSRDQVKDLICEKLVVFSDCDSRLNVQLYSYSNANISKLTKSGKSNNWKELDEYYVSLVRVDYDVPDLVPYLSIFMRGESSNYILSTVFIITPTKIRNESS